MTRSMPATIAVLGLLAFSTQAPAACRWFGTQLECDVGGSQLVIGAQRAAEPTPTTGFQRQCLQGSECFLDERAAPERPLRLEFQDVGVDPGLCRKVGNETYCY